LTPSRLLEQDTGKAGASGFMASVIITLMVLWIAWEAYRSSRRAGTWSTKQFLKILLAAVALCAAVSLPMIFVSPATLQAHEGLALASILVAIFAGVIVITIYAKRWKKRQELKRFEQNPTV
jgi:peptidoglycan biosynthesis protein MviN/MurJ (putative lipid II flippase)